MAYVFVSSNIMYYFILTDIVIFKILASKCEFEYFLIKRIYLRNSQSARELREKISECAIPKTLKPEWLNIYCTVYYIRKIRQI